MRADCRADEHKASLRWASETDGLPGRVVQPARVRENARVSIGTGETGEPGEVSGVSEPARAEWGRVADDGTVYVRTPDGERVVGSWQAGSPAEGLAYYQRRYDDLVTEVNLLDQRIDAGTADPKATLAAVRRLRESLPTAPVVGDLTAVGERLDSVHAKAEEGQRRVRAERVALSEQALARKRQLVEEAEQHGENGTQWKASGERLREIVEDWKDIRGVDRKADAELWKRLTAARSAFTRRRGAHFAQLDQQRKAAQVRKEELAAEAESLADSTDWASTARRLKELMTEWKAAPHASRETEDELWQRFRGAQDRFFSQRTALFAERDAASRENQEAKERLISDAERLDLADPRAAHDRLRDIQERYEKVGRVPREVVAAQDARMRTAEERVRDSVDARWQRSTAQANPLISQMREQVGKAETQVARARAAGDQRALQEAEASLARRREFLEQAERSTNA